MVTQSLTLNATPQQTDEWQTAIPKPHIMDDRAQKLVDNWHSACGKLSDLHHEVVTIQHAFTELGEGQVILGCRSFKIFCIRHLKRDASTVYKMLKKANFIQEPAPELEENTLFDQAIAEQDEAEDEQDNDKNQDEGAPAKKSSRQQPVDIKEATNAHYADRYLALIGLLNNAPKEATPEQIVATMRAEAEAAYQDLDAELAKRIKIPKLATVRPLTWEDREIRRIAVKISDLIVEHCQNSLKKVAVPNGTGTSHPGKTIIDNAKTILTYDQRPPTPIKEARPYYQVGSDSRSLGIGTANDLRSQGKHRHDPPGSGSVTYEPPTNLTSEDVQQSQPRAQGEKGIHAKHDAGTDEEKVNANVIDDRTAEYVMVRIAQGKSVDEKLLVQYEKRLSLKGDTERANALRGELAEWKSAKASK
jgi:hypothetical protein